MTRYELRDKNRAESSTRAQRLDVSSHTHSFEARQARLDLVDIKKVLYTHLRGSENWCTTVFKTTY